MKTIAYIDGGNLYHGLLRGLPASKWLDIAALVNAMLARSNLDTSYELAAVKYLHFRPLDLLDTFLYNPRSELSM